MTLVGVAGVISATGFSLSQDATAFAIIYSMLVMGMLLSITLAGLCCRKRFSGVRFMLFLLLWSITVWIAGLWGFYLISLFLSGYGISIREVLFQVTIMAAVMGVILYVIMLPFMILAFNSKFFGQRLYAYLQLKSMAEDSQEQQKT
jgi:hypothetical protein